mmetsp:Transcript_19105/g.34590  ORF Transcript_19105/g.34590 Transcript_19105/m.34590 type:complete len:647 (-) Transcript_19105:72-2012(-)
MPFFKRKRKDEFVGLEEEECNLRDMFGDPPGIVDAAGTAHVGSTSSSDFGNSSSPTNSSEDDSTQSSSEGIDTAEPVEGNSEAQELMNDNLELMREVVLKIREDEEYARNIYANCPRLQLLLNDHPELRPLFEDPKFVVLNFEKVYRDAGGTLPGDPVKKPGKIKQIKKIIGTITSHPLFKAFKILMLIKKIVFFFSPTKFMGILTSCVWPSLDDFGLDNDGDGGDLDPDDPEFEAEQTKLQLNAAADALEDPEVQEAMQEAMDDPDKMEEMIENNKELRELRDSNPLCAEMMNDPETLKIISDPENLRALSECPDLIAEDFANPDILTDAIENADVDVDGDFDADMDAEAGGEAEMDDELSDEDYSDEEEDDDDEDGLLDDVEYERDDDGNDRERERERSRSRGKARGANQQKQRDAEKDGEEGGGGGGGRFGFISTLAEAGLGMMDGGIFEEGGFDIFGGGDEMEGLEGGEDLGDGKETEGFALEDYAEDAEGAIEDAEDFGEEDENELLEKAEENLEDVEESEKEEEENQVLAQAEENLEDVEETEKQKEEDESTVQGDDVSEDIGVYSNLEGVDESAAGQGADLADELDAEKSDKDKDKDKEEHEARAREGGGGFYGDCEVDGGGFASGFKPEDPDDDWIRY